MIGDFNIQVYIIPYIHGLDLHVIFTDWTDTEDIYIFILWFSRKRRNLLEQNRIEQVLICRMLWAQDPLVLVVLIWMY